MDLPISCVTDRLPDVILVHLIKLFLKEPIIFSIKYAWYVSFHHISLPLESLVCLGSGQPSE